MSAAAISAADRVAIRAVLAAYVQVVDNADWEHVHEVFTPEARFAGQPLAKVIEGWAAMVASRPVPLFPHQCTDPVLYAVAPGVVRSWSKFFTVRTDGTITSGDYLDTFVRHADGRWRIRERQASLGNRPESDPFGPSRRSFTTTLWRTAAGE